MRFLYIFFVTMGVLATSCYTSKAATYDIDGDVVGKIQYYTVKKSDNLYEIARRFNIGIVELLAANQGVNIWKPKQGVKLIIPSMYVLPDEERKGIVINLSELRLFYFISDKQVMTFPIAIGKDGWETPTGSTKIVRKRKNPVWIPPQSIREENPNLPDIIPAGPDNPLGEYALNLGFPAYVIHGTNRPYSVGKRSSHGCIRLYPEDISKLFKAVDEGVEVNIIDEQYKIGWQSGKLFVEVMPTQKQTDFIVRNKAVKPVAIPELHEVINNRLSNGYRKIEKNFVEEMVRKRNGIPTEIGILE